MWPAALFRASKWNAVALMDEWDVFTQEKNTNDVFKIEQVSGQCHCFDGCNYTGNHVVLLRALEYFSEIMFLTTRTNRVSTIARLSNLGSIFQSPIRLCLLNGLWEAFILKGNEQQRPRWLTAKFLDKLSREDVNGRKIKKYCPCSSRSPGE